MTAVTAPQRPARHGLRGLLRREKPAGRAGIDRPRLLSDIPAGERTGILLALAAGGVIFGHVIRYDWAAVYYNALETNAAVTAAWHGFLSVDWQRHLARFGVEGVYTGAVVQIVFYGIRRWPAKAAGWWTWYVKRFLLIPSDRLAYQSLWCLALAPLWIIAYALPWGIAAAIVLDQTGTGTAAVTLNLAHVPAVFRSDVTLAEWQQPLVGFLASFAGARRVIKGTAFHAQRLIIRERLENGHTAPAWWMKIFPYLAWRFEWQAGRPGTGVRTNRTWKHPVAQRRAHRAVLVLAVLAWLALTYQGWHVLSFFDWSFTAPFRMS